MQLVHVTYKYLILQPADFLHELFGTCASKPTLKSSILHQQVLQQCFVPETVSVSRREPE